VKSISALLFLGSKMREAMPNDTQTLYPVTNPSSASVYVVGTILIIVIAAWMNHERHYGPD